MNNCQNNRELIKTDCLGWILSCVTRQVCVISACVSIWALKVPPARCLAWAGVYHPFVALPVWEQAVTVSHAYCPCASSSNLSIPPSTLRALHKMCISRAALSAAHAERTCSVALQDAYHSRISASKSPQLQIPANENAQRREGGKEGEKKTTKRERNPTHTDTNRSWGRRAGRLSHFLLTCKRDWCGCLYQWVCMSCLPLSHCAWMCWLHFLGIHENRLIFARATTRVLDPGEAVSRAQKALRYLRGAQPVRSPPVREEVSGYHSLLEEPDAHWTRFFQRFYALWNRGCLHRRLLIFTAVFPRLLLRFSEIFLQGWSICSTPKSEMDNSPGGKSTLWFSFIMILLYLWNANCKSVENKYRNYIFYFIAQMFFSIVHLFHWSLRFFFLMCAQKVTFSDLISDLWAVCRLKLYCFHFWLSVLPKLSFWMFSF